MHTHPAAKAGKLAVQHTVPLSVQEKEIHRSQEPYEHINSLPTAHMLGLGS